MKSIIAKVAEKWKRSATFRDSLMLIAASVLTLLLSFRYNAAEWILERVLGYEAFQLDEIILTLMVVVTGLGIFARRRWLEHRSETHRQNYMQGALQDSEERYQILFESAPDAMYLNDFGGTFIDGNRAAEKRPAMHVKN